MQSLDEMSGADRQSRVIAQAIATMEAGHFMTNEQRAAHTGPLKVAADTMRAKFLHLAQAAVVPFLGSREEVAGDSCTALDDSLAMRLPYQLKMFLPVDQQTRLVID